MSDLLGPNEWTAIFLSLRVALVATLAALPLAIWIAYVLARKSFPGRQLLNGVVHLPLVLPPVVTGYLLLVLFGQQGPIGGILQQIFGISFAFRWTGAALAAAIMAFPLMVRAIRLGFEAVDPGLEDAAATLGASRVRIWLNSYIALSCAGRFGRCDTGFCKGAGRIWRDDYLCCGHSGADANDTNGDLWPATGAWQ